MISNTDEEVFRQGSNWRLSDKSLLSLPLVEPGVVAGDVFSRINFSKIARANIPSSAKKLTDLIITYYFACKIKPELR